MKIKKYGLAGLCIMMAVIVAFCYSKQQETVIVGINLALSGENQAQGEATERGIVLAKNQLETAYSQELASHFKDAIERHGGEVLVYQDVSGDVDTSAVIAALKAQSCQAVYLPVSQEQAAVWIPSLRDAGIGCPVLGPDSWQGELLAAGLHADYLRRVFYAAQYATDAKDPVSEDFAEEYYEMYGELPDSYAALGYDAFMLLAKAAENGQSVKREDIAAQLQQLREYQGVTGCMLFDGQHNPVKPVCILTFWENEPAFLEKQQAADI